MKASIEAIELYLLMGAILASISQALVTAVLSLSNLKHIPTVPTRIQLAAAQLSDLVLNSIKQPNQKRFITDVCLLLLFITRQLDFAINGLLSLNMVVTFILAFGLDK